MKRKYVPVRMRNEVLERIKKEALTRGLSVSETIFTGTGTIGYPMSGPFLPGTGTNPGTTRTISKSQTFFPTPDFPPPRVTLSRFFWIWRFGSRHRPRRGFDPNSISFLRLPVSIRFSSDSQQSPKLYVRGPPYLRLFPQLPAMFSSFTTWVRLCHQFQHFTPPGASGVVNLRAFFPSPDPPFGNPCQDAKPRLKSFVFDHTFSVFCTSQTGSEVPESRTHFQHLFLRQDAPDLPFSCL